MIRSMTGYGSASHSSPLGEFSAEVRSLNNRFLDLNLKLSKEVSFMEPELRELVKSRVERGKVELFVRWNATPGTEPMYEVDRELLRHYAKQTTAALEGSGIGSSVGMGDLLSLPGVIRPTKAASGDGLLREAALIACGQALEQLDASRKTEGSALADAIVRHLHALETACQEIEQVKDHLAGEYESRLRERMDTLAAKTGAQIDQGRLETELMFFADKSDITEELVRLASHLRTLRQQLVPDAPGPTGKAMDFLVQELLREVNTIGNKAKGLPVASRTVKMKSEIEKIREQVQNIE